MKTVLVLGGSGYLGQFLVQDLAKDYKVRQQAALQGHLQRFLTPQSHRQLSAVGWLYTPQHFPTRFWGHRVCLLGKQCC